MADDTAPFEELLAKLEYPMYIVTAAAGSDIDGCLVGFATQCSISPPRFLACLSTQNRTTRLAAHATHLVVHVLRETDHALAEHFGTLTGDEENKLDDVAWSRGPEGIPVLTGVDWFAGRIVARHDLGDHIGHVLDVHDGSSTRAGARPLGYQAVRDLSPGHAP